MSCNQDRSGQTCLEAVQRYDTLFSAPIQCPSATAFGASDVMLSFGFPETGCSSACRQGLSEWVEQFACCSTVAAQEQEFWWQLVSDSSTSSFSVDVFYGAFPTVHKYNAPKACSETARHVSTMCALSHVCAPISVMAAGDRGSDSSSSRIAPLGTCCSGAQCLHGQRRPEQRCACQCPKRWTGNECGEQRSYVSTIFFHVASMVNRQHVSFPLQVEERTKENLALIHSPNGIEASDIHINSVLFSDDCLQHQSILAIEVRILVRQTERPERDQAERLIATQLDANSSGALLAHGLRLSCNVRLAQGEFVAVQQSCQEDPKCCSSPWMREAGLPCCAECAEVIGTDVRPPETTPTPRAPSHPFLSAPNITGVETVIGATVGVMLGIALLIFYCSYIRKLPAPAQKLSLRPLKLCSSCCAGGFLCFKRPAADDDTLDALPVRTNTGQASVAPAIKNVSLSSFRIKPPGSPQTPSGAQILANAAFGEAGSRDPESSGGFTTWRTEHDLWLHERQLQESAQKETGALRENHISSAPTFFLQDEHLGLHFQESEGDPAVEAGEAAPETEQLSVQASFNRHFPVTLSVSPADVVSTRVNATMVNDGLGFGGPPRSLFQISDRGGGGGGGGPLISASATRFSPFFTEQANSAERTAKHSGMSSKFEPETSHAMSTSAPSVRAPAGSLHMSRLDRLRMSVAAEKARRESGSERSLIGIDSGGGGADARRGEHDARTPSVRSQYFANASGHGSFASRPSSVVNSERYVCVPARARAR